MRKINKKAAAVAVAAVAVTGTGVAYAYYAGNVTGSTQNGAASATQKTVDNLTVTLKTAATGLFPGSTAQSVVVTLNNPNSFYVSVAGKTLTLDTANLTSTGDCTAAKALLVAPSTASAPAAAIAGLGSADVTFAGVYMTDSATVDQSDCNGKTFNIPVTVS